MTELLLALIPLALAAAIQPVQLMTLIFLLQTERAIANAWAFIGGMTTFHLGLGGLLWVLITQVETSVESGGGNFDLVVGSILLVLGLMLLVYGLRRIFSAEMGDEAAASWLVKLQSVTPIRATLVGFALLALDPRDWLFTLAAVDLIAAADLEGWVSLLAYLVFILLVQSVLIIPMILVMVSPEQSKQRIGALNVWLVRNEHVIEILVAALLGAYFTYAGLETMGLVA